MPARPPIVDCGEPLVEIPAAEFFRMQPAPYVALGAPYGAAQPWQLRRGVLAALTHAQSLLMARHPAWRFMLFDAYRPLAVQHYMVWREFRQQAQRSGDAVELSRYATLEDLRAQAPALYARLAPRVFEFWSPPSADENQPPPHSTGAAIDLTLADVTGQALDMGGQIDETSPRSYPLYYAQMNEPQAVEFHRRRESLHVAMRAAGFHRHAHEWWHFSLGDPMWAQAQPASASPVCARYGRVD